MRAHDNGGRSSSTANFGGNVRICQFMHLIFRFFGDSFSFNRLSSKLVGMLFGIVHMFVFKDFVLDCFIANSGAHAHFGAYLTG